MCVMRALSSLEQQRCARGATKTNNVTATTHVVGHLYEKTLATIDIIHFTRPRVDGTSVSTQPRTSTAIRAAGAVMMSTIHAHD